MEVATKVDNHAALFANFDLTSELRLLIRRLHSQYPGSILSTEVTPVAKLMKPP
jgi:hypothetical protein